MENRMQRYKIIFAYALMMLGGNLYSKGILLENPVLHLVDGIPYAIDGTTIKDMIHIRREVRMIQFGAMNADKKLVGHYQLDGNLYSIHQLAMKERAIEVAMLEKQAEIYGRYVRRDCFQREWHEREMLLKNEYEKMVQEAEDVIRGRAHKKKSSTRSLETEIAQAVHAITVAYEQRLEESRRQLLLKNGCEQEMCQAELAALEEEHKQLLAPLQPLLRAAKDDFKRINEPYLASVSGTKSMMVMLVEESCQRRGRHNSFLLEWAHVPEGQELESFEKNMQTLQALDVFCSDLSNFLEDVISSCPKGCAQAGLTITPAA